MFSATANAAPPSATTRSSRRRQRPLSSESLPSQPKPKRQRSALGDQTFLAPDDAPEMQEIKGARAGGTASRLDTSNTVHLTRHEIAVRGKKTKLVERGVKGDGSVILTRNDTYSVTRLPAWPDVLQANPAGQQHGAVYSENGYALSISHTHAIVWPYASNNTSPETFSFILPHPTKHSSGPLPIGSLVSPSASSPEPGLVVVMPTTGKVTYWESVASATTMDLIRQERNGVQISIPGMLSGESVIQILNAEPAGFVLGLSSGRLAYMSIRDGQGRPNITVQFLRSTTAGAGSGIFGSLRNALISSVWRGDLAAARAAPSLRPSERDVVTVTAKGRLQLWNLHRGGHHSLQTEVEARDVIVQAMKETDSSLSDLSIETFEVLDFAFAPTPIGGGGTDQDNSGGYILFLVSLSENGSSHYALVQVVLSALSVEVDRVRHITSYMTPINRAAISRPRVYLPSPGLVAFLVFDRAMVVASMARQPVSPDSQLLGDSHILLGGFEDAIDFRHDAAVEITGSGMEEPYHASHFSEEPKSRRHKAKFPAAVLLVNGGGIIRVAATEPQKLVEANGPVATAKSKLEQAVFFGTQENNPIDFRGRAEQQFTAVEVAKAAILLSYEIASSTTSYIPSLPASVDEHLRRRARALHSLATYLKETRVQLDRVTRWQLLWDAERIAAATLIWDRYDDTVREKPIGQKRGLLTQLVEYIHEDYKKEPVAEAGELDRVRHWFIHDVWRLEMAIPWAYQIVKYSYQEGQMDHAAVMRLVSEADDFFTGTLEAAFRFREANLELYGLQREQVENGILKTGYDGVPEFWTSILFNTETGSKLVDLAFSLVNSYWQKSGGEGTPDQDLVNKVRKENALLVDLVLSCTVERGRWLLAQENQILRNQGMQVLNANDRVQEIQIGRLSEIGLTHQAMKIAVKHRTFSTLVGLLIHEGQSLDATLQEMRDARIDQEAITEVEGDKQQLADQVANYFKLFGADFANALFKYYVHRGELYALIDDHDDHQQYLTSFLRSKPEFARLAWIQEVRKEHDFDRAAKCLLELGLRKEHHLWSKKVDLSIGKLARLAVNAHGDAGELIIAEGALNELDETAKQLSLIGIQEKVLAHVSPGISAAIDENAEVQLALEVYGNKSLENKEALGRLLEESMTDLVNHQALDALSLIDLLTLMGDNNKPEEQGLIEGEEFYLALQALRSSASNKQDRSQTERVIWRRCMLRDDWMELNNTDLKNDYQVSNQLRRTALYSTLRACFKNRLFEKPSTFGPVSPQGALGTSTEELDERFRGVDASIRGPLLKDMRCENETLEIYMEKCRLEKWFEEALDLAKRDIQEEMNRETEGGEVTKKMALQLQQMEQRIASNSQKNALDMLRSKPRYKPKQKYNGSTSGFRSSLIR